ncbi:MAG: phospholipid/cholesterol/gamma-HCH transport system ATP-binding protein [Limisphaerales bacterium]|jgi:phospholipid/cholesterol/gamma-HCH transport system ATP-binding protein
MSSNLIEIRGLTFKRGARIIFDNIDLQFGRGQITGVMGPSGTGKTTLLRLIGGQIRPDSGEIWVDGQNVATMGRKALFAMRKNIGMLFQSSALYTDLTVFENVAFPMRVHTPLGDDTIRDLVLMKLNAVGLRGARDLMPQELSGGMARRVALARAIALDPQLLMYDEPFTGQDPIAMGVLVTLIKSLNQALDTTSIVVSHDIHETVGIADQIYIIADGNVIGHGSPEELRTSTSERVRQFMHGEPDGPVPFHYPADDYLFDVLAGS